MESALNHYESVLVMEPSLSEEDQKLFFQKVKKTLQEFKGEFYHIDTWGVRKLANKNKKKWSQGLYFHFSFKGERGVVEELTRKIRMNEKVALLSF